MGIFLGSAPASVILVIPFAINRSKHFLYPSASSSKEAEGNKDGLEYQASSPDELALVSGARYFNYLFIKREVGNVIKLKIRNKIEYYTITHILEYTSDRKRMSVIAKTEDNKYILFSKGADSVIKKLITLNRDIIQTTNKYVNE